MKHKWRSSVRHEVGLALFAATFIFVLMLTVGPPWDFIGGKNFNYKLFQVIERSFNDWNYNNSTRYFTVNLLGNIAVFIPLGFFIYLLWSIRPLYCILTGLTISLAIECAQYPIGRWTDVDDLWLNTLGTIIGLILCLGFRVLAPKFTKGFRVK